MILPANPHPRYDFRSAQSTQDAYLCNYSTGYKIQQPVAHRGWHLHVRE
jgi:hypothetical protein